MSLINPLKPDKIIKNLRPLYFENGILYSANYDKIYISRDCGDSHEFFASLEMDMIFQHLLKNSVLAQRIFRASIYRMRVLSNNNIVLTFRKGVYLIKSGENIAKICFPIINGSRPTSLAYRPKGLVLFGDYWDNPERKPMSIHGSNDYGETWGKIYQFNQGEIRHIHGITYDKWEDCFWICTGDYNDECKLLRATHDFSDIRVISKGGQLNRFYSILATKNSLIMGTDSPIEKNYIIKYNKITGQLDKIINIENSSFYSCQVGKSIIISTVAEPSLHNDTKECHIWLGTDDGSNWKKILSLRIDLIQRIGKFIRIKPPGFFQFPRIFFPEGNNQSQYLFCHGIGIRKLDNTLFRYDLSKILQ